MCCPNPSQSVALDEYFNYGYDETKSPFLHPSSRAWGANLTLKSALLAALLLICSFALSWSSQTLALSHLLLLSVYFLVGIPALIESLEDLISFEINIDVLMTLAAFSSVLIGSGMEGALLLVLFALSGAMEDAVTAKAKSAISNLHKLSPTKATLEEADGTTRDVSVKDVAVGTRILVKAGQTVPLDGVVVHGTSSVNLVHLTGENFPVTKTVGDEVAAGARNLEGALCITVNRTSNDSTLTRIIQLVTEAQEAKPALQQWFDKLSRGYAISIILLAAFFALIFPTLLSIPFFGTEGALYRALAFLIAASPCALIIATPIAYLSAISVCAKKGVMLKGGIALDALAACTMIAFDKTGTLTTGELTCKRVQQIRNGSLETVEGEELAKVVSLAYALEKNAVHPIAKALTAYAEQLKASPAPLASFHSVPGYGLTGALHGIPIYIGRPEYIVQQLGQENGRQVLDFAEKIRASGLLLAVMLYGKELYFFEFSDTPRGDVKHTISALKKSGLELLMLTGDHKESAGRVAKELGIDRYFADLKPEDKLNYITQYSVERKLAMVGDGINDAPALARATVGICMGEVGSTTAIDASDIILLHDNINLLSWLVSKAKQTQSVVKENLTLAVLAILFASLPALAGFVPLWLAVVLHEGGTVLVGLNALRLLRF
jgi:Zn2+/Cd2+-exporting ATPase